MTDNDKKPVKRTLREKKFIDAYISLNGNAGKAYRTISPKVTMDSARELGKRMLKKVGLSIAEILDKIGLSDPEVAKILKDRLSATRESGRGENKKEILDHTIISKYIEMIFKLKASYPADRAKLELTGPGGVALEPTTITLRHIHYIDCPLKSVCPIKERVEQAGKEKGYNRDRILEEGKEKHNEKE